ncbi:LOW QUALITY PROTEIN: hypothetical protein PHMEG_00020556 [Phytophthora megakarya]|uniref:Uncharacterized protein n=1 Tax=Phytophthora megakarya TaxID=4795 RepID=A0A225VRE3_9STRA|nr:LOW QUALITY PROTEIN: hypothetical protein PHMEG_00020556 [Phytophthora megakarya]
MVWYINTMWRLDQESGYRVREGYVKKRTPWHGPFRVAEKSEEYAVGDHRINVQHLTSSTLSKIKQIKIFPDRLVVRLEEADGDRVNFVEDLIPEDS